SYPQGTPTEEHIKALTPSVPQFVKGAAGSGAQQAQGPAAPDAILPGFHPPHQVLPLVSFEGDCHVASSLHVGLAGDQQKCFTGPRPACRRYTDLFQWPEEGQILECGRLPY